MGLYPTNPRAAFVQWCVDHSSLFVAKAAEIGLSPAQASSFQALTGVAVDQISAQGIARDAAKSATQNANAAVGDLREIAAACVRSIRTFADNNNDPGVYAIANMNPPAPPSPAPPPGKPTDIAVALNPTTGAVELRWKAVNPANATGTSYIVRRRTMTTAPFEFVGVTGSKRFVDSTFLAGPDSVQYTIQGQRADTAGQVSDILTINFGAVGGGGGGGFALSSVEGGEMLKAA